jgi:hypothetical protein
MGIPKRNMLYTAAAALLFAPAAATFRAIGAVGGRDFSFGQSRKRKRYWDSPGMTGGLKNASASVSCATVKRAAKKRRNVIRHRIAMKRAASHAR